MKTRIIIQARMGSKRLRGKTFIPINGINLLKRVVDNTKKMNFADELIIATSSLSEDDPIQAFANFYSINCYRGNDENVLERFVESASDLDNEDQIIRITADNPINFINISTKLFELHIKNNSDYTCIYDLSHVVFEIVKVSALRIINNKKDLSNLDKEHVTFYFRNNLNEFRTLLLPNNFEGLRPELDKYLTVDTFEDLTRIELLFSQVENYTLFSIYKWLDTYLLNTSKQKIINLDGTNVGADYPTYVVAEIGQNHNGDIKLAKLLIDMAVRCGANAVKFQKRDISLELTQEAYDQPYDNPNSFGKTYGEHREFLEFDESQHLELLNYSKAHGITYFCTPCDIPSLEMLEQIGCPFYKVASRDLTNIPLLKALSEIKKPVIISTGMATYEDIDDAIITLNLPKDKLIIMQCTSEYPCKLENVNLKAIGTLSNKYDYLVGLSDHTSGVIISSAASTMGVKIIEKHISLDRTMKGTDQPGSLEEAGLKKLINYINAIELAQGDGEKQFIPSVTNSKNKLGRSLTSTRKIHQGEVLTLEMVCLKSPGNGIIWRNRNSIIGKIAIKAINENVTLTETDFKDGN